MITATTTEYFTLVDRLDDRQNASKLVVAVEQVSLQDRYEKSDSASVIVTATDVAFLRDGVYLPKKSIFLEKSDSVFISHAVQSKGGMPQSVSEPLILSQSMRTQQGAPDFVSETFSMLDIGILPNLANLTRTETVILLSRLEEITPEYPATAKRE